MPILPEFSLIIYPDITPGQGGYLNGGFFRWTLVLSYCQRAGYVRRSGSSWDLTLGAKELAKFLNVERLSLQALGLE